MGKLEDESPPKQIPNAKYLAQENTKKIQKIYWVQVPHTINV